MNAYTIRRLVDYMPLDILSSGRNPDKYPWRANEVDRRAAAFSAAYMDLAFGNRFAKDMASLGVHPPPLVNDGDNWVYRAWAHYTNPDAWACEEVALAREWANPSNTTYHNLRTTLNALLMSIGPEKDRWLSVSRTMGLPVRQIRCYERLFYNVVDRLDDAAYTATVVYPMTRLEEYEEDYMLKVDYAQAIVRVAYNHGGEAALYFAGYRSGLVKRLAQDDGAGKLEKMLMAHGLIFALTGAMNGNSQAIERARNIIAAIRSAGEQSSVSTPFNKAYGLGDMKKLRFRGNEVAAQRNLIKELRAES